MFITTTPPGNPAQVQVTLSPGGVILSLVDQGGGLWSVDLGVLDDGIYTAEFSADSEIFSTMSDLRIKSGELSSAFLERFPELKNAPGALLDRVLDEAIARTPRRIWRDQWETGVLYLAAHLIAINPMSRVGEKCCDGDGGSMYLSIRKKIPLTNILGMQVAGEVVFPSRC